MSNHSYYVGVKLPACRCRAAFIGNIRSALPVLLAYARNGLVGLPPYDTPNMRTVAGLFDTLRSIFEVWVDNSPLESLSLQTGCGTPQRGIPTPLYPLPQRPLHPITPTTAHDYRPELGSS